MLVDLQQAKTDGLTGTVVERADLGIPAIPGANGQEDAELTSLVSGTHTLRVRYSAPDKARLAVLGTYSEYDIIRNGKDVWTWDSKENAATHRTVTAEQAGQPTPTPSGTPRTPEEAADQVLKALEPTTTVTSDSSVEVAGRPAYELVLDPKDSNTLISQARIAIDGDTKLPLRVQVFGPDNKIVFEVAYTSVDFTRPDDAEFVFNPPPGAKVTEVPPDDQATRSPGTQDRQRAEAAKKATKVVGTGWTAVTIRKIDTSNTKNDQQLKAFRDKLQAVSGSWGSGRLLAGTAFSAVWTDDGRLAVGAVRPDVIYQALSK